MWLEIMYLNLIEGIELDIINKLMETTVIIYFIYVVFNNKRKMWKVIGIIFIWRNIGGFDWVIDIYDSMTLTKPIIDPMTIKVLKSIEDFIQIKNNLKYVIVDINMYKDIFTNIEFQEAIPGIQNIDVNIL